MQIKNCAAIVTGGASGMGAATANMLRQAGAKVALLDLNFSLAEKTAKEIGAIAIACDVTSTESVENAIAQAEKKQGAARICVNCAGVFYAKKMLKTPLDEFRKIIDINLIGTFNVMRFAALAMTEFDAIGADSERGVIINTASIAAFEGQIGQAAYSATKGGVVALTLPAARELAQFGIRVMTIAPGLFDTPLLEKLSPEFRTSLEVQTPFPQRLGKPEEYAKLVQQIIENPMLNGEVIRLDGALRMQAS